MDDKKTTPGEPIPEEKGDLRVVLQFFIVPLALVVILVLLFFGLQLARHRDPDPQLALERLSEHEGVLSGLIGDPKRWQYGYDLSLLLRSQDEEQFHRLIPDLTEAFRSAGKAGDLQLRRYLALALGRAADPRAAAPLREGMSDDDPHTRLFAAWGLSRSGDPTALPELRSAATDPDPGVRKVAVFALGQLADIESLPILKAALADSVSDVSWNAALSLARLGDPAGVPVLIDLLERAVSAREGEAGDPRDRALNAIRGLAILRAPEALEPLDRVATSSADPEIREAARVALAEYRGESPVERP